MKRKGFQGKYRFRLYDFENECFIDLTTDEVQCAFLRLELREESKDESEKNSRHISGLE
jgi:hypothetical protein